MLTDSVLIYDCETRVFGKPDPTKDLLKIFACYSYKTGKTYLLKSKEQIQKIINAHKFLVGFNNVEYDNPVIVRFGVDLKYKIMIDLRQIFKKRASQMKIKKGMLGDLLMIYSLDFITKTLGIVDDEDGKLDINYDVFKKENWTKEELKEICVYAERDIDVTRKLFEWVEEYFESFKSYISQVDVDKKVYLTSSIAKFAYKAICKAMNWPEDYGTESDDGQRIGGGFVAYPAGERFEGDIFYLDFASLYPHIMIQCNLYGRKQEQNDRLTWFGGGKWKVEGAYYSDKLSGVGELFKKWYADRVVYKKSKDPRDFSLKIILNASYGILNNPYYVRVYDRIAGGDCTRIGRQWIKYARKEFENADYKTCYADSVGKDSLIRTNNGNFTIEELFLKYNKLKKFRYDKWKHINNKEIVSPHSLKVLSLNNNYKTIYDKVIKIIRHKSTKKKYKIILNCYESLIVTEDHSMIWFDDNGKLISKKPYEVKYIIGLKNIPYMSLSCTCRKYIGEYNPFLSKKLLQLLGFWIGDGGSDKNNNSSFGISTGLDTDEFIKKIVKPLNLDFFIGKNKYDIGIKNIVLRKWMDENGFVGTSQTKKIPSFIFNLPKFQICAFLSGLFSSDGSCGGGCPGYGCTNEYLVKQARELLYRVGICSTMKRDFEPNHYKGVIGKNRTFNFWLKVMCKNKFKNDIGFIFDRKNKKILNDNRRFFATKKIRSKLRNENNVKRELVYQKSTNKYVDLPIRRILKIEEIEYDDYVYDLETKETGRFYANDILVHNTDSVFVIDKFKDKQKMLAVKDRIINDIKETVSFPQNTFDIDIDDEIKYIYFFKGRNKEDKETDKEMDEFDFFNKPRGLLKKNYVYVTKDNRVVVKNLGIKKKSNSKLSKKIFNDYLVPEIKKGQIKFSKTYLRNLMMELLEKDMSLATLRKDVGDYKQYEKTSPGGIHAQIAKRYGSGIWFLIPNTKGLGVGKGKQFCTMEEFKKNNLRVEHIELDNFWKELNYFLRPAVTKNIFDFGKKKEQT